VTTLNLQSLFHSISFLISLIVSVYIFEHQSYAKQAEDVQVNSSIFHASQITSYEHNQEKYDRDKKIHSYHWALALCNSDVRGYLRLVQGARAFLLNVNDKPYSQLQVSYTLNSKFRCKSYPIIHEKCIFHFDISFIWYFFLFILLLNWFHYIFTVIILTSLFFR